MQRKRKKRKKMKKFDYNDAVFYLFCVTFLGILFWLNVWLV